MGSDATQPPESPDTTIPDPKRSGSRPTTSPSTAKKQGKISADRPVWERQAEEPADAYAAFTAFRDSDDRLVKDHGDKAYDWSSYWSWGYRAYEWDIYLARKDEEDAVRYRRQMNQRQRAASRLAQNKIAQFLMNLDPEKLTPQEAARWYEVAVKVERTASGEATDRVAVQHSGKDPTANLTAEEVRDALRGIQAEIEKLTEAGEGMPQDP